MYLKTRGRHLPAGGVYTQNVYVARTGEKNNKKLKDVSLMRRCLPENWNQKFN